MRKSKIAASVIAILCAVGFTSAAQANECQFDRNLTVAASPVLQVSTGSGDVTITAGNDNSIHIHGRVKNSHNLFGGEGNVQAVCDRPPIEQNGNDVRIGKQHDDIYRHVSIDYTIETPRATDLNASSGSGNLDIADISGHVAASTGSGDIGARHIAGDAKLETGSGTIRAIGVNGGSHLSTGSGDIHLEQTAAGDVHAGTGSGSIDITGMNGGLTAGTGSGRIHVGGTPAGNWKLETGSGDVRLKIDGGKGYELDAETSSGDIHVDQPITMQGSLNKHHVHGTVGGGGSMIRVSTGSGDMELH
jgi:DUF4097 and DUF4098 domain-containing protein YvlB